MITPEEYGFYLLSEEWQEKRDSIQDFCEGICMECNDVHGNILHHETYENIFEEPLDDLLWVCKRCHNKIHRSGRVHVPYYAKRKYKSEVQYLT